MKMCKAQKKAERCAKRWVKQQKDPNFKKKKRYGRH
jgi:hypothetical protein